MSFLVQGASKSSYKKFCLKPEAMDDLLEAYLQLKEPI